jgi:hypothetical protein
MSALQDRVPVAIISLGFFALIGSSCVVPGGGFYDQSYYEPFGIDYGGWGVGYDVGPARAGEFHGSRVVEHGWQHAYRPVAATRAVPSIPTHAHAGGAAHGRAR